MKALVKPSFVSGTITVHASKSAMQRACAAALIKGGKTILQNPGDSDDDKAALDIIQKLGASIEFVDDTIIINSNGIFPASETIDSGESGLSVRMFTSIAALSKEEITVTGRGSLSRRPLTFFEEVLPALKVACKTNGGLLPLKIKGPLVPSTIEVDGSLSSQFLTGLLFAFAAADATDISIFVKDLNSKPYIDLTLKILSSFGLKTPLNKDYKEFYFERISASPFLNESINYTVEGDWSGAAFLLVAGAISGKISVRGLDIFSAQADKAILQALMQAEASISIAESEIQVSSKTLKAFHFNATDCPDLFPPLVALASFCEGKSVIEGTHRLTHKESNRALTLKEEFQKLGVLIDLEGDLMIVRGLERVKATNVSSRHDHRIAMACAIAALKADGEVTIDAAEAVDKSYPKFWKHLQQLKADVSLIHN